MTRAQGNDLFRTDLHGFVRHLNILLDVPLPQEKYDALVDFIFNEGPSTFGESTLRHDINSGDVEDIRKAFLEYVKAKVNGQFRFSSGLFNRRMDEINLYENGQY